VTGEELDPDARVELRTLPKDLATRVARHLVMAGRLLDDDAAEAYKHARAARRLASRVGAVREACGFAAYHAGEWADALAELRAARRLPGREDAYLPVMADCERGLGRPERALDLAKSPEAKRLATEERVELRIVESGARRDLGQYAVAVVTLQIPELKDRRLRPWSVRLLYAYADALADAGREDEAREWFTKAAAADRDGDTDAAERLADLEGLEIIDTEEAEPAGDTAQGDTAAEPEVVISEAGVPGIAFGAEQGTSTAAPRDPVPEVAFSPPPSVPPVDPAAED
jgi:tetratricopeptide (TPR) repeat protein